MADLFIRMSPHQESAITEQFCNNGFVAQSAYMHSARDRDDLALNELMMAICRVSLLKERMLCKVVRNIIYLIIVGLFSNVYPLYESLMIFICGNVKISICIILIRDSSGGNRRENNIVISLFKSMNL